MASLKSVTSRPTREPSSKFLLIRKNGELLEKTDGVRHLSVEIRNHILKNYIHEEGMAKKAYTMAFVNLKPVQLTESEIALKVRNARPVMMSHYSMISLLVHHVEHMHTTGEVDKLPTTPPSDNLKELLQELKESLESLKLDITIYASIKEDEHSANVINLSNTFVQGGVSLYNETLRAFGMVSDIEKAMDCLYTFYKANEKALASDAP